MSGKFNKMTVLIVAIAVLGFVVFFCCKNYVVNNKIKSDDKSDINYSSESVSADNTNTADNVSEESTETITEVFAENESVDEARAYADEMLTHMTIHEKICQMFIISPEAATNYDVVTYAGETLRLSLVEYPVCGYIFFSRNLKSIEQTESMIENLKQYGMEANGIPLFIGVDEEGGDVARCAFKLGTTSFSPMYYYHSDGEKTAYENAYIIASDISELGFNLDFAPVADTWSDISNTVIGTRAYSSDYNEAAELVAAATKGFDDGGVVNCLKHFPGYGDTMEDSHKMAAYLSKSLEDMAGEDYIPFEYGINAGADMIMIGHLYLSDEDIVSESDKNPASLNYKVISEELRGKLGFNGVVITDALNMGAVSNYYTSGEAVKLSVKAGADIMLMPVDFKSAVAALEEAVENGEISEERIDESVRRILMLKYNKLIIK
ncbi:MAG: glycoside hydrolase family 3 protein [Lachnospiraceae bacterium]|nr:glycoside hydrolase family 3 protein [Lachnospiraceae bacterium]